ncbi:MAG: hypothetical protein ACI9DC_002706 [Gammaproteobacteria bacterium]|jgi:hypothetical protein
MRYGVLRAVTRGAAPVTTRCQQLKMSLAENAPPAGSQTLVVIVLLLLCVSASAAPLEFSLHQIEGEQKGPVVLVIGGIQGDEPGGFNAASLLATHYRLHNGAVWVVPNLNFESIVQRSRGVHGDMNRKFPAVPANDPDYARVERIKTIITDPKVSYVLNLHDGSGFYRPRHIDAKRSPKRWGQSIIIDQDAMSIAPYAPLAALARRVSSRVNKAVIKPLHQVHVKNTKTRDGNVEMAKTLTYFAINKGKPAVGIEASKSLPTHLRVYYHLHLIEAYLHELGVRFERRFTLTPESVRRAVDDNINVAFYDRRLVLSLAGARRSLRYVPMKKNAELNYEASSPLVAIRDSDDGFRVSYGNRRITRLHPQFFDFDASLTHVSMTVDGAQRSVAVGSAVDVQERFLVDASAGLRVNVIGWRRPGIDSDAGVEIRRKALASRFSVDRDARLYRVEFYRGRRFAGMVLVRFVDSDRAALSSVTRPLS